VSHPGRRTHYNVTLAVLTFACVAYAVQQTMVIPALPIFQRDLHTTTAWAAWLFTAFLLTSAVATPLLGKLGDQYGKERVLLISLSVFFVGCVGASFAGSIWSLIAWRALQGVGGAVFPLSFAIIRDEFPAEKVGSAVGLVSAVFVVGGGLGLVLSGLLVDQLSWRWIFIVGAILVGTAAVLVHFFVPESPVKTESRVDVIGAVLLSGGLVSLLLSLTEGDSWGWGSARTLGLLALSAVLLIVWGLVELRVREPMVDMRMLAKRPVLFTNVTALLAGWALFGAYVLVPTFAETPRGLGPVLAHVVPYGFGASPLKTGLYLLPGSLVGFVSGPMAGRIGSRFGWKWPLSLGMMTTAVGAASLALWHDHPWQIVLAMLVLGGGAPLAFAAMAKLIMDAVRPSETGVATGMNTVMRTIGGVVGGQVGAAILTAQTIGRTSVPTESAFTAAFWISAAVATVAVVIALLVTPWRSRSQLAEAASV
jgi:EmrB/QacA subfamily drug resistance transporter